MDHQSRRDEQEQPTQHGPRPVPSGRQPEPTVNGGADIGNSDRWVLGEEFIDLSCKLVGGACRPRQRIAAIACHPRLAPGLGLCDTLSASTLQRR